MLDVIASQNLRDHSGQKFQSNADSASSGHWNKEWERAQIDAWFKPQKLNELKALSVNAPQWSSLVVSSGFSSAKESNEFLQLAGTSYKKLPEVLPQEQSVSDKWPKNDSAYSEDAHKVQNLIVDVAAASVASGNQLQPESLTSLQFEVEANQTSASMQLQSTPLRFHEAASQSLPIGCPLHVSFEEPLYASNSSVLRELAHESIQKPQLLSSAALGFQLLNLPKIPSSESSPLRSNSEPTRSDTRAIADVEKKLRETLAEVSESIRITVTRSEHGWHIWLGLDAQSQRQLSSLLEHLQRIADLQRLKIVAVTHNGKLLENHSFSAQEQFASFAQSTFSGSISSSTIHLYQGDSL